MDDVSVTNRELLTNHSFIYEPSYAPTIAEALVEGVHDNTERQVPLELGGGA